MGVSYVEVAMNRQHTLDLLKQAKPRLVERYGVTRLALFGSTARNSAGPASDVDLLVGFDGPATADRYFGVLFALEDVLGRPVDLVTTKALRPEWRDWIEREAVEI
jgi:predicted nucleotidyltransferase